MTKGANGAAQVSSRLRVLFFLFLLMRWEVTFTFFSNPDYQLPQRCHQICLRKLSFHYMFIGLNIRQQQGPYMKPLLYQFNH